MMLPERIYVTIEIALQLKQRGYNIPSVRFFCKMYDKIMDCSSNLIRYDQVTLENLDEDDILIPTIWDAQSWFRDKEIEVNAAYSRDDKRWFYWVQSYNSSNGVYSKALFKDYSTALINGLPKAFELL